MKSTAFKFVALSLMMCAALALVQSDSAVYAESDASQGEDDMLISEQVVKAAESKLKKQEEEKAFRFPNVFDALRFIF